MRNARSRNRPNRFSAPSRLSNAIIRWEAPVVSSAQAQKLALPDDIQIHLREVTLRAALQELEKQSGLPFDLSALDAKKLDAKISIDIDTPSVNRALSAIADEANLKLFFDHGLVYDSWHVKENRGKVAPRLAPESVDGLFAARLLKVDVTLFKQLDLDAAERERTRDDSLNLTLEMAPDPGLPLGSLPVVRLTRAEDDEGRSLLKPEVPQKPVYYSGSVDAWNKKPTMLKLLPPAADARRIAHLEGEALYKVAVKRERWEVPDLLETKRPTHNFKIGEAEVKITLLDAKIQGEVVTFWLEIMAPPGTSWQKLGGDFYSIYGIFKWITVRDASGTRLVSKSLGGDNRDNRFTSRAYCVLPPAPHGQQEKLKLKLPLQFTIDLPTDWVQAQTKFKFDDVPLP